MGSLKRAADIIHRSGLGRMLAALLNILLWITARWTHLLSRLYAAIWSFLGVGYYDQRFNSIAGPSGWRWAERGYFAYLAANPGSIMLDLCCGDGIYPGVFLRALGGSVDAIDLDPRAIAIAMRRYGGPDIRFLVGDVITDPFPRPDYDMASCFATFQYLTIEDANRLLSKVAKALIARDGTFVGSVPLFEPPKSIDSMALHNFRGVDEVKFMMATHFERVEIWCSIWEPGLTHCYFKCGQPRAASQQEIDKAAQEHLRLYPYQKAK